MQINLSNIKRSGVFLIYHKTEKRGIVVATRNLITYLLQNVLAIDLNIRTLDKQYIQDFHHDNLDIKLLEDNGYKDTLSLNLRLTYWTRKLQSEGWNLYSHQKKGTNYEVVIKLIQSNRQIKAHVMLKPGHTNSTKNFFTIGLFNTMAEAENWVQECYPNRKEVYNIMYASNDLSKKWFQKREE